MIIAEAEAAESGADLSELEAYLVQHSASRKQGRESSQIPPSSQQMGQAVRERFLAQAQEVQQEVTQVLSLPIPETCFSIAEGYGDRPNLGVRLTLGRFGQFDFFPQERSADPAYSIYYLCVVGDEQRSLMGRLGQLREELIRFLEHQVEQERLRKEAQAIHEMLAPTLEQQIQSARDKLWRWPSEYTLTLHRVTWQQERMHSGWSLLGDRPDEDGYYQIIEPGCAGVRYLKFGNTAAPIFERLQFSATEELPEELREMARITLHGVGRSPDGLYYPTDNPELALQVEIGEVPIVILQQMIIFVAPSFDDPSFAPPGFHSI